MQYVIMEKARSSEVPQTAARLVILYGNPPYEAWAAFPVKTRPIRSRGSQTQAEEKEEDELDERVATQMDETLERLDVFTKSKVKGHFSTIRGKRVWVPEYERHDTSGGLLQVLRGLLDKILSWKSDNNGFLTDEQYGYAQRKLKELELRSKYFKQQKQRAEVFKVLKGIRKELEASEHRKHQRLVIAESKESNSKEVNDGLRKLGYDFNAIAKMSDHEAKTIYWNEIHKSLEKARSHKYIRREGLPENYTYIYHEPQKAEIDKPWSHPRFTDVAEETGKKLTREQAIAIWDERKSIKAKTFEEAYHKQYLREQVEAYFGYTGTESLTEDQIEEMLGSSIEKAHTHKYIKRLGMPGRFQYFYQEHKAKEKKKEVNAEDLIGSKYWGILGEKARKTIQQAYDTDAKVFEGYTIGEHTKMVLEQYNKYFNNPMGGYPMGQRLIPQEYFRLMLAIHDLGKAQAIIKEGDRTKQYDYNREAVVSIFEEIRDKLRSSPGAATPEELEKIYQYGEILGQVVSQDAIGEYLKHSGPDPEFIANQLIYSAEVAGQTCVQNVTPKDFFDVAKMYFMCDAGAYTKNAGGVESLDYMFKFTEKDVSGGAESRKGFTIKKMDFSTVFKKKMDDLEDALKKLDMEANSPSVAVYHGTSCKYLANIIKEGLKAKKYRNFRPDLYKGGRDKEVFVIVDVLDAKFFANIASNKTTLKFPSDLSAKDAVILKLQIPNDEFKKAKIDGEWGSTGFMLPEVKPEWIEKVATVEPIEIDLPAFRRGQDLAVNKVDLLAKITGTVATRNAKIFDILYDTIWEKIKKALEEQFKIVYLPMSFDNWLKLKEKLN